MNKFILYTIFTVAILSTFYIDFINNFEDKKESIISKYQLQTKSSSLYLQENLKRYLNSNDEAILENIKSLFNDNFKSINIEKATFTLYEKDLINLASNLNKNLQWEITNLSIDNNLGDIVLSTQSDDLQKELLTIEGSIPNDINKNLIASSDIYTFIPSKNFKNLSSLEMNLTLTNQLDETFSSTITVDFNKNISSYKTEDKFKSVPIWFKDFVSLNIDEEISKVNNSLQNDAIFYLQTNIDKIYFELFEMAKIEFLYNFILSCISIFILFTVGFILTYVISKIKKENI